MGKIALNEIISNFQRKSSTENQDKTSFLKKIGSGGSHIDRMINVRGILFIWHTFYIGPIT